MFDNKPEADSSGNELIPASENIWYALATIAGEPTGIDDIHLIEKNRSYWNAYIRELVDHNEFVGIATQYGHDLVPTLTAEKKKFVEKSLIDRGFDVKDLQSDLINLRNVEFSRPCHFEKFLFFREVEFTGSKFNSWCNFKDAIFLQDVKFTSSTFGEWSDFLNVTFKWSAIYDSVEFEKNVSFRRTTFDRGAFFTGAKFSARADFCETSFGAALDFGPYNYVRPTKFESRPPDFFNANTPEDVSWSEAEFPSPKGISRQKAIEHKDAYERLGLMMDKLNKHHDKHMFFRLEMRARRQIEKRRWPRWINRIYECLSDYGYGVGRATCWWFGNVVIGFIFLIPWKGIDFDLSWQGIKEIGRVTLDAFATSLSNAHGFLGLGRGPLKESVEFYKNNSDLLIPYNVTAFIQTIFGAIFLFFVLLCMRNRFRMG